MSLKQLYESSGRRCSKIAPFRTKSGRMASTTGQVDFRPTQPVQVSLQQSFPWRPQSVAEILTWLVQSTPGLNRPFEHAQAIDSAYLEDCVLLTQHQEAHCGSMRTNKSPPATVCWMGPYVSSTLQGQREWRASGSSQSLLAELQAAVTVAQTSAQCPSEKVNSHPAYGHDDLK